MSSFTLFTREEKLRQMPLISKTFFAITGKDYPAEFEDEIIIPEALIAKVFLQMCPKEQLTIISQTIGSSIDDIFNPEGFPILIFMDHMIFKKQIYHILKSITQIDSKL